MDQELTSLNPAPWVSSVWKRVFWCFQAAVTCALVLVLCRMCQWDRLATVWSSGDPRLWVIGVVLLNLSLLAGAFALLVLVRIGGQGFRWPRFVLDYAHVQSLCQVTPGQIGEALLPFMHGSAAVPSGAIAAGLLLQRMVAVLIVSVTAVCFASSWTGLGNVIAYVVAGIIGCTTIAYLISHDGARAAFNRVIGRRCGPILSGFYCSWLQMVREDRMRRLLPHVSLMIFRFAATVLSSYFVFLSFEIAVPIFELTGILAIATLATVVPISLNGLGIVEAVIVLALRPYGLRSEEILSACVTGRGLSLLVLLGWSLLFWMVRWSEHRTGRPRG